MQVGYAAVVEEIGRTFLVKQTMTEKVQSSADTDFKIQKIVEAALRNIEAKRDHEMATIFSLVPQSHIPVIATGKRCQDSISKELFIVLGFKTKDKRLH